MASPFRTVIRLARLARVIGSAQRPRALPDSPDARARWQQKQARLMLEALEIKVEARGAFPTSGLLVCNHLSYLDVLSIASQGLIVFVSKSDVLKWPAIGRLLVNAGTIVTYRDEPMKAGETATTIEKTLKHPLPVALFPEGTSSAGETVLPFRSPLFQPAHSANTTIAPAAIRYTADRGDPSNEICYWGDHSFFPHLAKLAALDGVTAHLIFGDAEERGADRKASASTFHERVSELHSVDR